MSKEGFTYDKGSKGQLHLLIPLLTSPSFSFTSPKRNFLYINLTIQKSYTFILREIKKPEIGLLPPA